VNDFIPDQTVGLFRLWFALHGCLIVPAVLLCIYELYFDRLSIYALWFAATTANSVLSGKWGAGDSYFATSIAAMCILSGIFASRMLRGGWHFRENYLSRLVVDPFRHYVPHLSKGALLIVPLLYIGYGRAVLHMPTDGLLFSQIAQVLNLQANATNGFYDSAGRIAGGYADIGHLTTQADIEAGWRIVELAKSTDKPVLSEEAAFNLWAGKEIVTNPTQLLNLATGRPDLYDATGLVEMIEKQAFGLIVLRAQFYPTPVLAAIGQAYEHDQEITMNGFDYIILRPKSQ
jgi:hypothetical protein